MLGPNTNQCTVTVSGVTNAQYHVATLTNVTDAIGEHSDSLPTPQWGLLFGDVNSSGGVYSDDIGLVRNAVGQAVTSSNFRDDATVDGSINNTDVNTYTPYKQTTLP